METLEALDREAFLAINGWHAPWSDGPMLVLSDMITWFTFYLVFLFLIKRRFYRRGLWWAIPVLGLMILCSDKGSVILFKETVQRLRPCHEPTLQGMVHLVKEGCGGRFGFVSSHASNHFAIALFMIGVLGGRPRWAIPALLAWASLVAYSRVYLGVHYPGDVLVGGLYGAFVGILFAVLFRRVVQHFTTPAA